MNLTGQPVYQKGQKWKRGTKPTIEDRRHWESVRSLGCMARGCKSKHPEIHHCGTGAGGRKNHMLVIGLCHLHHRGLQGIHTLSRRVWEALYGTEQEHLASVAEAIKKA
jgi:hypothetical protein